MFSTSSLLLVLTALASQCIARPLPTQDGQLDLSPGRSAVIHVQSRQAEDADLVHANRYVSSSIDLPTARVQSADATEDSQSTTVVVDRYTANTEGHVVPDPGEGDWRETAVAKSRSWLQAVLSSAAYETF